MADIIEHGDHVRLSAETELFTELERGRQSGDVVANAAVYALETLQTQMAGVAESVGWASEDDVTKFIKSLRHEEG